MEFFKKIHAVGLVVSEDTSLPVRSETTVHGTGSTKADDSIAYAWTFQSKPEASLLTDDVLIGKNTQNASFTPDVPGEYVMQLTATNMTP